MRIEQLSVVLKVDKATLQEYATKVRATSGMTKESACFVASEEEKSFTIRAKNRTNDAYNMRVFVDGRLVVRQTLPEGRKHKVEGARINSSAQLPFKFASFLLTDDESFSGPSDALLQELGSVRIEFRRISGKDSSEIPKDHFKKERCKNYEEITAVPEKSKKLGSHCVKFGNPIPCPSRMRSNRAYIDPSKGEPYCQFIFKYRPKGLLRAQGIIPLDRTELGESRLVQEVRTKRKQQAAAEDERRVKPKIEPEDAAELEVLLVEQEALESRIREIKARNVKREPSPIVFKFTKGETIDLTSD